MVQKDISALSKTVGQKDGVYLRAYRGKRIPIAQSMLSELAAAASQILYREWAGGYDLVSWIISLGCWRQWQRLVLLEVRGNRVLEIGFGTGNLLAIMGQAGLSIYGLEPSPTMHQITTKHLRKTNVQVPRVQALSQAIPFAVDSFDTVIAIFPAEYITSPATLQECARILKESGGRLIIIGLWVGLADFWRHLGLMFYGKPSMQIVEQIQNRLVEAGFGAVTFREIADGPARVGLIVADRTTDSSPTSVNAQELTEH